MILSLELIFQQHLITGFLFNRQKCVKAQIQWISLFLQALNSISRENNHTVKHVNSHMFDADNSLKGDLPSPLWPAWPRSSIRRERSGWAKKQAGQTGRKWARGLERAKKRELLVIVQLLPFVFPTNAKSRPTWLPEQNICCIICRKNIIYLF